MKKLLLSSILLLSSALTLMAQFAVNTTSATICAGSCATITAAPGGGMGPYTYSWNPAATGPIVSVCPTVTTTYTVFVTDMMGGTGSAVATVTVNPPPTPTITGITNVCNGSSTTLTANAGGSYLWNTGANTAIITVAPATTTTYTVTVTTNGCTGSASIQVTVCTGIKEQTSANGSIKVYPNPFMDNTTFTIQSDKQNEKYSFELYDVLGKQVRSVKEISTKQFQVSRNGLPNGIYFYKIYNAEDLIGIGKVVIE